MNPDIPKPNDSPNQPSFNPSVVPPPTPGKVNVGLDNRTRARLKLLAIFIIFIVLVGVVAYFELYKSSAKTPAASSQSNQLVTTRVAPGVVGIGFNGFTPATINVKVGQSVIWTNNDSSPHSVVSDDPNQADPAALLNSNGSIDLTKSYDFTFHKAGSYPYHDTNDASLRGTVVVK